jgi:hypothetical protein
MYTGANALLLLLGIERAVRIREMGTYCVTMMRNSPVSFLLRNRNLNSDPPFFFFFLEKCSDVIWEIYTAASGIWFPLPSKSAECQLRGIVWPVFIQLMRSTRFCGGHHLRSCQPNVKCSTPKNPPSAIPFCVSFFFLVIFWAELVEKETHLIYSPLYT